MVEQAEHHRPILTVGHSTHPIERFLALLGRHRVTLLADLRSLPSSRRWPQFNQAALEESLKRAGVDYRWLKRLGGRRRGVRPDSPHTAWTHPAFRSYADYMETAEFEAGLAELTDAASQMQTAYMCAEGLWWQCHRRIISDVLVARGWHVEHILPDGKLARHQLAPFARVASERIVYDKIAEMNPDEGD